MPRSLRIESPGAIYHLFFGSLMSEWICSTDWNQADLSDRPKVAAAAPITPKKPPMDSLAAADGRNQQHH